MKSSMINQHLNFTKMFLIPMVLIFSSCQDELDDYLGGGGEDKDTSTGASVAIEEYLTFDAVAQKLYASSAAGIRTGAVEKTSANDLGTETRILPNLTWRSCTDEVIEVISDDELTVTLDFGQGCTDCGTEISGKITETYSFVMNELTVVSTFEAYSYDSVTVNGEITSVFLGSEEEIFGSEFDEQTNLDLTLIYDNGSEYELVSSLEATSVPDKYTVSSKTITITGGSSEVLYSSEVNVELVYDLACAIADRYLSIATGGVESVLHDGVDYTLDYGNGECDESVTITEEGEETEADMSDYLAAIDLSCNVTAIGESGEETEGFPEQKAFDWDWGTTVPIEAGECGTCEFSDKQVIASSTNQNVIQERMISGFNKLTVATCQAKVTVQQGSNYEVIVKAPEDIQPYLITEVVNGEFIFRLEKTVCIVSEKDSTYTTNGITITSGTPLYVIEMNVTVPDLEQITVSDIGEVEVINTFNADQLTVSVLEVSGLNFNDLVAQELRVNASSASGIKMNAKVDLCAFDLSGASFMDTTNIESIDTYISLSGASGADVSGQSDYLDVNVNGASGVNLFEFPTNTCYVDASGTSRAEVDVLNYLDATAGGLSFIFYEGEPEIRSDIGNGSQLTKAD